MKRTILDRLRNYFLVSVSMLEKIIEICPDELWSKKEAGFIFWQQILHTIYWGHFWLRSEYDDFSYPFKDKNLYPENFKNGPEIIPTSLFAQAGLYNYDFIDKKYCIRFSSYSGLALEDNWKTEQNKINDLVFRCILIHHYSNMKI